ncbi:autotransporter outer membrane beta-barrel domain-containing protein [Pontibacter rugosus]
MKTKLQNNLYYFLLLLFFLHYSDTALAQTPGLIYRPATAGGAKVLDPNGDGYVSVRPTGFVGSTDEGAANSEIPYRPFPALSIEPIGDLDTGSAGSHTDLAPPATPLTSPSTGSPFSAYYSGNNLLIRTRLGGSSTASKGYSVLIDADQTFTGTGTNPGFEYEVLLASNFSVQVIRHSPTGSNVIFSGSVDQYSQKAVAASTAGGNADYFYDFYVPLSAFGGGITATMPLRMSGITVTSAQSGLTGTVSDVGGVNFQAYNYNAPAAWRALINGFPATSLNQLNDSGFPQVAAAAPVITGPITAGSTSITGTSVEATGSTVTIIRNSTQIGTATVADNGTWTLSGLASGSLTTGSVITATVTAAGKSLSSISNAVTVTAPFICTATTAPALTGQSNGNPKYAVGTTPYVGRQLITLYSIDPTVSVIAYNRQGSYIFTSTSAGQALPTSNLTVVSGTVTLSKTGNYVVTTTPVDANNSPIGCESIKSNQICFQNGGVLQQHFYTIYLKCYL